ncbi:hypothetical protein OG339_48880 (plasmid) [Streptosporangium sp. NBC_01495]|uniref:hypothetical protein n=1 Tax=Streptosporangium sp. NBC_01495 TaxID=2903899 RepID=UPI002E2EDACF|nr:hypothetical protein [Streptosporangium sp. NBC_01495]
MTFPQQPSITAMTVNVRVMKIGSRQISLSLFKQLCEEALISHDGALNGTAWGFINYHPDKCESSPTLHRHLVWVSANDELLRYRLNVQPAFDMPDRRDEPFACQQADRLLTFQTYEWISDRLAEVPLNTEPASLGHFYRSDVVFTHEHLRVRATASDNALRVAQAKHDTERPSWPIPGTVEMVRPDLSQAIDALKAEIDSWDLSYEQANDDYHAAVAAEHQRRQRHRELHRSLGALPQLFIGL